MNSTLSSLLSALGTLLLPLVTGYALHRRGLMSDLLTNFLIKLNVRFVYGLLTLLSFWVLPLNRDLVVLLPFGILYVAVPGLAGMFLTRGKLPDPAERGASMMSSMLSNIGTLSGVCAFILYADPGFAYCQIIAAYQNILLMLVCFPLAGYFQDLKQRESLPESTSEGRNGKKDRVNASDRAETEATGDRVSKGGDAVATDSKKLMQDQERTADPEHHGTDHRSGFHWGRLFGWNQVSLLGIGAGLLLNAAGVRRPELLGDIFPALVHAGAWIALLPVGCLISFRKARSYLGKVREITLLRFVLMPLFIWCAGRFFFTDPVLLDTMLLCALAPTAINAVLTSRLYGLNTDLAVSSFVSTTALYLLVIFPLFVVLHG